MKLKLVHQSIGDCEMAAKRLRPGDVASKVAVLLLLAEARVEHANCVRDETFHQQKRDLTNAIQEAREAAKELQGLPQADGGDFTDLLEADLTQGNAHEDLAWICHEDPPENYRQAIAAFKRADVQRSQRSRKSASGAAISASACKSYSPRRHSKARR